MQKDISFLSKVDQEPIEFDFYTYVGCVYGLLVAVLVILFFIIEMFP